MPKADPESDLLIAALRARGVAVDLRPWGEGVDWSAVPLVVVRTPWDYTMRRAEFLAWVHATADVTRLVNPAKVIDWNSHKGYLLDLAAAGVPVVDTVLVRQAATQSTMDDALRRYPGEVVVKPAVSAGARRTVRAPAGSRQAGEHLAELVATGDALVQPMREEVLTEGEVSLVYFAGEFSHAVRKVPAPGDYRVHEYHGGRVLPHEPTGAQLAVGAAALAAAPGDTTYARVDLVRLADPAVMELELIEPELFLRHADAAARYAEVLTR